MRTKLKFKPKLTIALVDLTADPLDATLVRRLQSATRNVRLNNDGWLRSWKSWRHVYAAWLKKVFPEAWIYIGGHHVAVHAGPPDQETNQAGRCLFRLIEVQPIQEAA